jgi:mono/diheme cytochrome c family protein
VDAPALNAQEFLSSVTDQQMRGIIAGGIPGTEMPAWWNEYGGPLTDQQLEAVVAYIRSWEKDAPSVPDWRSPAPATGMEG